MGTIVCNPPELGAKDPLNWGIMTEHLAIDAASVLWSVGESEREAALAARPLLALLHGRGSNEQDLFSLVPMLPRHSVVASVRAPLTLASGSYSWFPVGVPGLPSVEAGDSAVRALLDWLDSLPPTVAIGLIGFSQGGAMVIHALRHAPDRFSAIVNLAGFVISGDQPTDLALQTRRPPVFWGRDVEDPMIPADAIERTTAWLPGHSTLTARLYPSVGHSISREEIDDVDEFLTLHIPLIREER